MSPLMYAAREGRATVCEVLLDHDAEINKQDMRGWTVSCCYRGFHELQKHNLVLVSWKIAKPL